MNDDPRSMREIDSAGEASGGVDGFGALAGRLRSIVQRASSEGWRGWTDADTRTIGAAAAEIEGIGAALAHGMRQAFEIGREYGHREETLERLDAEIREVSGRLARQAWGRTATPGAGKLDSRTDGVGP